MILGETYRKIREEKGISISSLAGAEISKSQISRFELGETEISVFKLLYLLERIGVTLEEFLLICNHYQPIYFLLKTGVITKRSSLEIAVVFYLQIYYLDMPKRRSKKGSCIALYLKIDNLSFNYFSIL